MSNPTITPFLEGSSSALSTSPKQFCTKISKRLSGRSLPIPTQSSSLHSISNLSSAGSTQSLDLPEVESMSLQSKSSHHVRHPDRASHIISQVADWLQREKEKKAIRKSPRPKGQAKLSRAIDSARTLAHPIHGDEPKDLSGGRRRSSSDLSDSSLALEKLERILSGSMDLDGSCVKTPTDEKEGYFLPRRSARKGSKNLLKKKSTVGVSDSEHAEGEMSVPSAEVVLDNSKTLGYSGGSASSDVDPGISSKRAAKEKEAWRQFKSEIVRLTHTLKISGWRRVPLERGEELDVERISGALTNAVYVVSPPKDLPDVPAIPSANATAPLARRQPRKLLLRIYGPQVEHLIDRESELQILRRLARKKIGPKLLGTFINGRFEEFFHARTLAAEDLRVPDTSKQIAKRMRELHDGMELLEEERDGGPYIWRNWDKWVERCEEVICWLDHQILANEQGPIRSRADQWKQRGLICGVEWPAFRETVNKYRKWLQGQCNGPEGIRDQLVFAHNDTQYGNLLRLVPTGESPLLLPQNSHKQLVVIDFEYASANVPGLEFANHFTEWCYDYHDTAAPHALHSSRYPTPEEQRRFLKAYIQHNPPPPATPSATPNPTISSFDLDARAPSSTSYAEDEAQREAHLETEIARLQHQIRLWRVANSAQWVAWGIVQAKVVGMDEALREAKSGTPTPTKLGLRDPLHETSLALSAEPDEIHPEHLLSDPLIPETEALATDARDKRPIVDPVDIAEDPGTVVDEGGEEEDGFDYLGYAQERAMFFWGDVLQLGLVGEEDLPQEVRGRVKVVQC